MELNLRKFFVFTNSRMLTTSVTFPDCEAIKYLIMAEMLTTSSRFDYLLISHFLLNLQDLSNVSTNDSDPSRPSFVRSDPSSIRFNNVLGNIGAPLRDGSLGFEDGEDEDVGVMLDQAEAEIQEVRRSNEEGRAGLSPVEAMHGIEEVCVAGPSRLPAVLV